MGWVGTAFLIVGNFLLTVRLKYALALMFIGNLCWALRQPFQLDMFIVSVIFMMVSAWNLFKLHYRIERS